MKQQDYEVIENRLIAKNTYEMKLMGNTGEIKRPGQFINLEVKGFFLKRPFSICYRTREYICIVYKIAGGGTEAMSSMAVGEKLSVLCPLGNGYDMEDCCSLLLRKSSSLLIAGGGTGTAPLYGLAKEMLKRGIKPKVILGFGSKDEVFYEENFRDIASDVTVVTEDGSLGEKGLVTDIMSGDEYVFACGPTSMLKAVWEKSAGGQFGFESRMGCGFGACMGCSCKTTGGSKRICREGPILKREEILW